MARKDVLKGLMGAGKSDELAPARVDASRPRYTTGAIGAVSKSIADLKRRSVVEIDPRMIDNAGMRDRLDPGDEDLAGLVESIRDYGQQVPVLLRPNPNDPERYQVVYGRRRVAALKVLHKPIKALIRVLDDHELVIAQGQENSARKDLTFIEKANFARQMRDAGYERKTIGAALHMDKTLISRMLSVADRIPVSLIEAIGSASSFGRDRWLALADLVEASNGNVSDLAVGDNSNQRFEAVLRGLKKAKEPLEKATATEIHNLAGQTIATASRKRGTLVVTLDSRNANGFDEWLVENLTEIHRDWNSRTGE